MTRSEACKILNISISSGDAQVKKAYRRLAMKYHPDRNSSAAAKDKFIEVHEAYQFLINPTHNAQSTQRQGYDNAGQERASRFRNAGHNFSRSRYADSSYRQTDYDERYRQARQTADEIFSRKSRELYQVFFDEYISGWKRKWVMFVAAASTLLALLFIYDHFTPGTRITTVGKWQETDPFEAGYFLLFDGYKIPIDRVTFHFFYGADCIVSYNKTPVFKDITNLTLRNKNTKRRAVVNAGNTVHDTFPIVPLLLFFPLLSFLFEKPSFNFVFFIVHANIYLYPTWIIYLLFNDDRIFRAFGF